MKTRLILLLIIFSTGCQLGRIPCPDARGPRIKKVKINQQRHVEYTASISAHRDQGADGKAQTSPTKDADSRFVKNVTVEEWDCPKPGEKRYMPKSVKENIRKNMKRIKSDRKHKSESDSLRTR